MTGWVPPFWGNGVLFDSTAEWWLKALVAICDISIILLLANLIKETRGLKK